MEYPSYLVHFNPNHDPKTGQFASSRNGKYSIAKTLNSRYKESTKIENKNQRKESLEKQLTDSNLDNYPNLKKAVLKDISDIVL